MSQVYAEATVVFPMIVAATFAQVGGNGRDGNGGRGMI